MSEYRTDCRWFLRYAGAQYCRRRAFENPSSPLEKLDLGCACDVDSDYQPQPWKRDLYGDPDERGDVPRVLELEDDVS